MIVNLSEKELALIDLCLLTKSNIDEIDKEYGEYIDEELDLRKKSIK